MTFAATSTRPMHRLWRLLLAVLVLASLGVAGQATAADIGADAAFAASGATSTSTSPVAGDDGCAPAGKKTDPGHCAACCMHMTGQLLADAVAVAAPFPAPRAARHLVDASVPPSVLVAAPDDPPQT